jgi:hypothetical protein
LGSSSGFRALADVFQTLQNWVLSLATPAYTTIRQWILKLGLYKLQCPKSSPNGWFFIIDTSIQMGPQKCVVVLGVKKLDINQNFAPSFNEVEALVVRPLHTCPGVVINEILEEAATLVGSPHAIISDEGSELKKGVEIFSQNHPKTVHLFDISHKINACLKKELDDDRIWLAYKTDATASIQQLKLSPIAHLAPPRQRTKARMHSAFPLVEWGISVLEFLECEERNNLTEKEKDQMEWLKSYRFALPGFLGFKKICEEGLKLVHEQGYYLGIDDDFLNRTQHLCNNDTRIINFRNKIKKILQNEGLKVPGGANYLGSSEIIESLFGKFKAIEGDHASSGLTSLVLAIPSLLGDLTESIVEKALQAISISNVDQWIKDNMGQTFLSQRRCVLTRNGGDDNEDLELCE